jgi:YihY family inner membrane protein
VSNATRVPETIELTGDDARKTLASTGTLELLRDSFVRLRAADGFSHARSLAFTTSLILVQGLIVLVGLASAFREARLVRTSITAIETAVPGPAANLLKNAVEQANQVGSQDRYLPLVLGLLGLLITATTAMGQLERSLNRLYGIEQDRAAHEKYARAFVLTVTSGTFIALSFLVLAFGRGVLSDGVETVLRWPLAILLAALGLGTLFNFAPRRRQPSWPWLAFGSAVAVTLWTIATLLLALAFRTSSNFGDTYGPLAGIVALQLWTLVSACTILYGGAVMAQLEAVRAGVTKPREEEAPRPAPREPVGRLASDLEAGSG